MTKPFEPCGPVRDDLRAARGIWLGVSAGALAWCAILSLWFFGDIEMLLRAIKVGFVSGLVAGATCALVLTGWLWAIAQALPSAL